MIIEEILVQFLGNSPILLAVLFVYYKLEHRIFKAEMEIEFLKGEENGK